MGYKKDLTNVWLLFRAPKICSRTRPYRPPEVAQGFSQVWASLDLSQAAHDFLKKYGVFLLYSAVGFSMFFFYGISLFPAFLKPAETHLLLSVTTYPVWDKVVVGPVPSPRGREPPNNISPSRLRGGIHQACFPSTNFNLLYRQ